MIIASPASLCCVLEQDTLILGGFWDVKINQINYMITQNTSFGVLQLEKVLFFRFQTKFVLHGTLEKRYFSIWRIVGDVFKSDLTKKMCPHM